MQWCPDHFAHHHRRLSRATWRCKQGELHYICVLVGCLSPQLFLADIVSPDFLIPLFRDDVVPGWIDVREIG
eukprot:4816979-Pyramimonas_sp.AAC.1